MKLIEKLKTGGGEKSWSNGDKFYLNTLSACMEISKWNHIEQSIYTNTNSRI
jgi:hypothetical protein